MMILERFSALNKSDKMSLLCTAIFWLMILILFALIPMQKNIQPKYESVTLHLLNEPLSEKVPQKVNSSETTPVAKKEEKVVENPVVKPVQPVQKTEEKVAEKTPVKAEEKAIEKPVSKAQEKSTLKPVEKNVSVPIEEKPLVKSVEQLMAENAAVTKKQKDVSEVDWDSLFAEDSVVSSSSSGASDKNINLESKSSLSGSAASAFIENENTSSSFVAGYSIDNSVVQDSTVKALGKISTDVVIPAVPQNSAETSDIEGTPMMTTEGKMRLLLIPEKPAIYISSENERLIDSSRELDISFRVLPSGQVESASIKILPASLVTTEIEAEIKAQVSKWLFQAASGYGQVCFKYNIMMK